MMKLRPKIILDGLFVDIRPYLTRPNVRLFPEEQVQGIHSYYVFNIIDITAGAPEAELLEKVWIDRNDLQVSRKQVFADHGTLQTDVEYQNYQPIDRIPFPQIV